jgi:hypothetical protein
MININQVDCIIFCADCIIFLKSVYKKVHLLYNDYIEALYTPVGNGCDLFGQEAYQVGSYISAAGFFYYISSYLHLLPAFREISDYFIYLRCLPW